MSNSRSETPYISHNHSRIASVTDLDRVVPDEPAPAEEDAPLLGAARQLVGYSSTSPANDAEQPGAKPRSRWAVFRQRSRYYVPGTAWIPNYSLDLLLGDFIAGATLASILIPQSISYASSLAKLGPLTGLFSAAIPGLIYSVLGSCPQLSVGPEASLALIVGQAISSIIHSDHDIPPEQIYAVSIAASTVITFQVGVFTFLLGFVRLGFVDVILSRALLRGFVTAIGCVIAVEQLIPMFGLVGLGEKAHLHTTLEKMIFLVKNLTSLHPLTTIVSFCTLLILVTIRQLKRLFVARWKWSYLIPEVFLAVVFSTIISQVLRWDLEGVPILGDVSLSSDDTYFAFPLKKANLAFFQRTTGTAILISIVGFLDSLVSAKQNSTRFGYPISLNRELVALGSANFAASFVPGTLPAFGAITRSRLNADSGCRTPLASVVCSTLVILAMFFLLPFLHFLPKGVLAAIICLVVFSLVNEAPEDIHFLLKLRAWSDLSLMAFTFTLTLLWNVEVGIMASLAVSLLLVIHRSSRARLSILGRIPGTDKWRPINEDPVSSEELPGVLIVRVRENLDFANTAQLKERLRRLEVYGIERHHPADAPRRGRASVLVFHMADVENIDASATQIFLELLQASKERGVGLYFAHLKNQPKKVFDKAGIIELLGTDSFQPDIASVIRRMEQEGTLNN